MAALEPRSLTGTQVPRQKQGWDKAPRESPLVPAERPGGPDPGELMAPTNTHRCVWKPQQKGPQQLSTSSSDTHPSRWGCATVICTMFIIITITSRARQQIKVREEAYKSHPNLKQKKASNFAAPSLSSFVILIVPLGNLKISSLEL